ncbi:MAG: 3 beta-hydroxysteroid dehydrogenase/Delta 5--_4-isomerase [Syntrophus sp. PtaB.Bin001]|nr:MAG: 3 beta-hydroxysteroid dehydrogenase/Delta 5-->4-isomerase [Syntrophus sp. PtaB.Bin001]
MKVLITGGTGAIGPRVVDAMYKAGFMVRVFSADPPFPCLFPESTEVVVGNINDKDAVRSSMQGVEAVVHMAALLHIVNPTPELREKYEQVNVNGTATVVDAAIREGVGRVVLFSTIAVYGEAGGRILNEKSLTRPETYYARTKLVAEGIVLDAKGPDGKKLGVVLRLGAVYGSRIKGNYERLTKALARNRFVPVGKGFNRRTLVYDKDVGNAAVLAVSHPDAAGMIFNVTDGTFHTLNEIIESICSALGRRPPLLSLPVGPTRALMGLIEKGCGALGIKPFVTRGMLDKYTEDIAVDGSLIQKELGFVPHYDLKSGWEETIKDLRKGKGI